MTKVGNKPIYIPFKKSENGGWNSLDLWGFYAKYYCRFLTGIKSKASQKLFGNESS